MADTTFIKFLFREEWASLKEVLSASAGEYGQIHDITDEKQLSKIMVESQPTLIIASVKSKEDVAKILAFLKAHRRLIKENSIKFSAVNFTYNRQVEAALMKIGCQEVLDPGVKGKALKYKLDFWKKALNGGAQKGGDDSKLAVKDKAADAAKEDAKKDAIKWENPLNTVDDMWLMRATDHAKKVLGKWLVKIMGPSPFVGQWVEAVPGKKGIWKYAFKEGIRENFHKTEGHWYFMGDQKPEFIWKENLWMVTGSQFQLVFQNGDEKAVRFTGVQGQLTVCKNSPHAKAREASIIETFDQEVLVKKGLIAETSTEVDADQDVAGHYKGKTEGEEAIDNGPMEGKSSTDDLGGNMEGDIGEQEEGDTGPYSGKSSTDKTNDAPDGKSGADNLGADKYKGKMEFGKDQRTTDWGGESETDDLGPSHYSNQKKQAEEEINDKSHKLKRDALPKGAMNGDLETDDLGPSHYSNQKKEADAEIKDKKHALKRDALPTGEMNGDLETEDLGPSHMGGKKKASRDELPKGELNGALETENRGPAHMGGKAQAEAARKDKNHSVEATALPKGEMNGDLGTDDLGAAHMGGKKKEAREEALEEEDLYAAKKAKKERREAAEKAAAEKAWPDGVEPGSQEDYFRQMKDKKQRQQDRAREEAERIAEAEAEAKVVPIMRDKLTKGVRADEDEITEDMRSPDYKGPAVTSNAVVKATMRLKGDNVEVIVHVDDFFDGIAIFRAESGKFSATDDVEISMSFDYLKKTKKVEVSGVCTETDADGEGSSYVTVQLAEEKLKLFEQFMELYRLRQAHIEEFMKQAKGL